MIEPSLPNRCKPLLGIAVGLLSYGAARVGLADNQTPTVSPVHLGSSTGYGVSVRTVDVGSGAELPTLQSFASATYDGKWIMLAGRTNGMHGFGNSGASNFPVAYQNREVWVIDPATKQSWHRSLADDSTLGAQLLAELSTTNTQHAQVGDRLYLTGGYGAGVSGGFQTFNELAAIDLPGITNWVVNGAGNASASIRAIRDDAFKVTGGSMYEMNGRMHLVFGQNFNGGYNPNSNGAYTQQVRSFDIVDDGTNLSIANYSATTPQDVYRRRDLNIFPTLRSGASGDALLPGLEALSGVFTPTNGAWTVPVKIDENGQTSMADPNAPGTFRQAMNGYESAKLGLFSRADGSMHEVLFGGISLVTYESQTQSFAQDDDLPFTSQITQVNIDSDGNYSQDLLGEFPDIRDQDGKRMLYGAEAQFFLAEGIPTLGDGIIDLDALSGPTVLGYIYGGIFSNSPHTRNVPGAVSGASNDIFEVVYSPVPEPATIGLIAISFCAGIRVRQSRAACDVRDCASASRPMPRFPLM